MQAHSLYLHIPFCHHRCSYCDFNTYAGMQSLLPEYVDALCREVRAVANSSHQTPPIHTIFFGGGTPSLLSIRDIERILATIEQEFTLQNDIEITLEANPGDLKYEYLKSILDLGVNRISLGMQSANPEDLLLLERQHDFQQVIEAVSAVRMAGFTNLNLDIIFGIPYQTLASFLWSLELGISLAPEHFSVYALTVENGTPLGSWVERGLVSAPDPDLAADMYDLAAEKLSAHGYEQYEISNWAAKNIDGNLIACQHNLQYWRNLPYVGCGAGAHGFAGGKRTEIERNPVSYIEKMASPAGEQYPFPLTPATIRSKDINRDEEMKETMMMGLRLTQEGVLNESFSNRFGFNLEHVFMQEIEELIALNLLEWDGISHEKLRLTPYGYLLGNQVFMKFV